MTNKRSDIRVDATCDIETEGWDNFVVGGLYRSDGSYFESTDRAAFWRAVLTVNGSVWAHNGGGFDYKDLLDFCHETGRSAQIQGNGDIVSVTVGHTRFCDSFRLFQSSLEKFTAGLGVQKQRLSLPCRCGKNCGGYCTISHSMSASEFAQLSVYLRADCLSLFQALQALRSYANTHDIDLSLTVGSSAWKLAKRRLGLPSSDREAGEDRFIRAGYYGGRVQAFYLGAMPGPIFEYDVQSMYPWALSVTAVPWGAREWRYSASTEQAFLLAKPGFYRCTVEVPKCRIPPLPLRLKSRLSFPWGQFTGTWAYPELAYAVKECGVKVVQWQKAIVFDTARYVFAPLMQELFDLRHAAPGGKSGPVGTFLKFMANSLTGKFGQKPDKLQLSLYPDKLYDCTCQTKCRGKCGCSVETGIEGVYARRSYTLDACGHVEWAGYLTAVSRVKLHKQLVSCCDGACALYCDTDSVYSIHERKGEGPNLGDWEKATHDWIRIYAPKVYCTPVKIKAKGLKFSKAEDMLPCTCGEKDLKKCTCPKTKLEGITGLKGAIRNGTGFFVRREGFRRLNYRSGDRIMPRQRPDFTDAPNAVEIKEHD